MFTSRRMVYQQWGQLVVKFRDGAKLRGQQVGNPLNKTVRSGERIRLSQIRNPQVHKTSNPRAKIPPVESQLSTLSANLRKPRQETGDGVHCDFSFAPQKTFLGFWSLKNYSSALSRPAGGGGVSRTEAKKVVNN